VAAIRARLAEIDLSRPVTDPAETDLLAFYHSETLRQISALRAWLLDRGDRLDPVDAWLRMVAINRLTGHSNGLFSVYTMPSNQAVSAVSQRKINQAREQAPPPRDLPAIILKKTLSLLADGLPPPHPAAILLTGPAQQTMRLADASVDLIVTSPPFLDVVDYEGVRGGKVLLERHVAAAIEGLPFDLLGVMVNRQSFTRTANCWGVKNNRGGTNTNRIVMAVRR
jgi:hypothetical protein